MSGDDIVIRVKRASQAELLCEHCALTTDHLGDARATEGHWRDALCMLETLVRHEYDDPSVMVAEIGEVLDAATGKLNETEVAGLRANRRLLDPMAATLPEWEQ